MGAGMGKVDGEEELDVEDVRRGLCGRKSSEVGWFSKRNGMPIGSEQGP